jgi:arylsulfatase A-like enzyme
LAVLLLILASMLVSNCRKTGEGPSLIRLIDLLERKNVADSPLLDFVADPKGFTRDNPTLADMADNFPLLDLGAGANPLLLKKKMHIGPAEENALFAPPKTVLRFKVKMPVGSLLEFYYGLYWGNDPGRKIGATRQAEFVVRVRSQRENAVIFRKSLTLTPQRNRAFNHRLIDLSRLAGQDVVLEFTTRGTPDTLALWYNPIIFRPRMDARNVILISLDTLRADHLGCYGYGRATSPSMDKLAEESVLFKNVFATAPWTLPSHVSMLTGLDAVNHQVYSGASKMDPGIPTLADFLRQAGYVTAAFTGGGFVSGLYGLSKGFDTYLSVGKIAVGTPAAALARTALPWIQENRERGFFLFLHTYQIHQPYQPPAPFGKMFLDADARFEQADLSKMRLNHENRFMPEADAVRRNFISLYDGEIRFTDEVLIGALVAELKKLGLYDRTMIIVTADHGEEFFEHKGWAHTHALYNETIKVPLIIKFPGSRNRGMRVERLARLTDIMPTILEEMGVGQERLELDGRSLKELTTGDAGRLPERELRCELAENIVNNRIPARRSVSRGSYKIIRNDPFTPAELAFFPFPPPSPGQVEVYDLASDPGDTTNLAASRPDLVRSLLKYMDERMKPTRKTSVTRNSGTNEDVREELKALGYIR